MILVLEVSDLEMCFIGPPKCKQVVSLLQALSYLAVALGSSCQAIDLVSPLNLSDSVGLPYLIIKYPWDYSIYQSLSDNLTISFI